MTVIHQPTVQPTSHDADAGLLAMSSGTTLLIVVIIAAVVLAIGIVYMVREAKR